jgi:hypothetical protein
LAVEDREGSPLGDDGGRRSGGPSVTEDKMLTRRFSYERIRYEHLFYRYHKMDKIGGHMAAVP